jgi:hypothetical protein
MKGRGGGIPFERRIDQQFICQYLQNEMLFEYPAFLCDYCQVEILYTTDDLADIPWDIFWEEGFVIFKKPWRFLGNTGQKIRVVAFHDQPLFRKSDSVLGEHNYYRTKLTFCLSGGFDLLCGESIKKGGEQQIKSS